MRDHLPLIAPEAGDAVGAIQNVVTTLAASAFVDSVTELLNGAALEKYEKMNERTHNFGAIFLDLSGFKEVNDKYGHEAGDAALSATGQQLKRIAQDHQALVFRKHGDEFVLLLKDHGGTRGCAQSIAEAFFKGIGLTLKRGEESVAISIRGAVGFSVRQDRETTLKKLIEQADAACRLAKNEDGKRAIECSSGSGETVLANLRRRCRACAATATLLVPAQNQSAEALSRCPNCGSAYAEASGSARSAAG